VTIPNGITGLTKGTRPRFPRARIIRVGEVVPTKSGKTRPKALDHFVSEDPAFREKYGRDPRELACHLPPIPTEDVLRSNLMAYRAGGLYCHGDGITAERRGPTGKFSPVKGGCPECPYNPETGKKAGTKECKAVGVLTVVLDDLPGIEGTQIWTSSKNGMIGIQSMITALASTGLPTWEIPCVLSVKMEKVSTPDGKGGRARRRLPILHLDAAIPMMQLVERAQERERMMLGRPTPPMLAGPGVDESHLLTDPVPRELYPDAIDVAPADDLAQMETYCVELGSERVGPGAVSKWTGKRSEDEIRAFLLREIETMGGQWP